MIIGFDIRDFSGCRKVGGFSCVPPPDKEFMDIYSKYELLIADYYGVLAEGNPAIDAGFSCYNSFPLEWICLDKFGGPLRLFSFVIDVRCLDENDVQHIVSNRIEGVSKGFLFEKGFKSLGYDVAGSAMGVSAMHTLSMGPGSDLFRFLGVGVNLNEYGLFSDLEVASEAAAFSDILAPEHAGFSPVEVLMLER